MKTLKIISIIFLSLVLILAVHIYVVTRPKVIDPHTRVMARVDIKQKITDADASLITSWLYKQKGVDHVLCNTKSDIVVFTYYPAKANADNIINNLKTSLNLQASRYMPTQKDLSMSCPMTFTSPTSKVYNFLKQTF